MLAMAASRCGETPMVMALGAPGNCRLPSARNTVSLTPGRSTARNLANATATAAMVPAWMTVKRVQP